MDYKPEGISVRQSFIKPAERITIRQVSIVFLVAAGSRCTLKCYTLIQVFSERKLFCLALLVVWQGLDQSLLLDLHRKVFGKWQTSKWCDLTKYPSPAIYVFSGMCSLNWLSVKSGYGFNGLLWYSNFYRTLTPSCLVGKLNYFFISSSHLYRAFWWLPHTFANPWVVKLYFVPFSHAANLWK